MASGGGGASAIRFDSAGAVVSATTILTGTSRNCSGGATPWGTWLSCEEVSRGTTWECDPFGVNPPVLLDTLGWFNHEAAAIPPDAEVVYLTEDQSDGGLYRFIADTWPDLSAGTLEVLIDSGTGLGWAPVLNPNPTSGETSVRHQLPEMKKFNGGEGIWYQCDALYFTTKGDNRVWRLDPATLNLTVIYDIATNTNPILSGVDNVTGIEGPCDLYVAEDGGDMQIVMVESTGRVGPIAQLTGVTGSEITGVAFNPANNRLYFNSQRNPGATYEIAGPFRT